VGSSLKKGPLGKWGGKGLGLFYCGLMVTAYWGMREFAFGLGRCSGWYSGKVKVNIHENKEGCTQPGRREASFKHSSDTLSGGVSKRKPNGFKQDQEDEHRGILSWWGGRKVVNLLKLGGGGGSRDGPRMGGKYFRQWGDLLATTKKKGSLGGKTSMNETILEIDVSAPSSSKPGTLHSKGERRPAVLLGKGRKSGWGTHVYGPGEQE